MIYLQFGIMPVEKFLREEYRYQVSMYFLDDDVWERKKILEKIHVRRNV